MRGKLTKTNTGFAGATPEAGGRLAEQRLDECLAGLALQRQLERPRLVVGPLRA
jgi:hypothetical protein